MSKETGIIIYNFQLNKYHYIVKGKMSNLNDVIVIPTAGKIAIHKWSDIDRSLPIESGQNTAILTGEKSNLTVLDLDLSNDGKIKSGLELLELFDIKNHYTVQTLSGGLHIYFMYDSDLNTSVKLNYKNCRYAADVRNDGGYVLAPPSEGYQIINDVKLQEMPEDLKEALLKNHKPSKDRTRSGKINSETVEYILNNPKEYENFEFRNYKNGYYNFNRLRPSRCEFCNRNHDKDSTLQIYETKTGLHITCRRTKESRILKKYENTEPIDFINGSHNREEFESDEVVNLKYLENLDCKGDTLIIKSPKGSGKTTQIKKLLEQNEKTALLLSTRIALAGFFHGALKYLGFDYYQDKPRFTQGRVIAVLNSIQKIQFVPEILILDEVSQIIDGLAASTIKDRKAVILKFNYLLRNSKIVICLDADIENRHVDYIRSQRKNIHIIHNEYEPPEDEKIKLHIAYGKPNNLMYNQFVKDACQDKKIFIGTSHSIDWVNGAKKHLESLKPEIKVLTIHSKNNTSPEIQEILKDINAGFQKYDVVIATTCISSGVDFNPEEPYFDRVYGFYYNNGSVNDQRQLLGRIRKIKQNEIFVELLKVGAVPETSRSNIENYITQCRNLTCSDRKDMDDPIHHIMEVINYRYDTVATLQFEKDFIYNLWIDSILRYNTERKNYESEFIGREILERKVIKYMPEEAPNVGKELKQIIKGVKIDKRVFIAQAEAIDYLKASELMAKASHGKYLEQSETAELTKFSILNYYDFKGDIDEKFIQIYEKPVIKAVYANTKIMKTIGLNQALHDERRKLNELVHLDEVFNADFKSRTNMMRLVNDFTEILGVPTELRVDIDKKNIVNRLRVNETSIQKIVKLMCQESMMRADRIPVVSEWLEPNGWRPLNAFLSKHLNNTYGYKLKKTKSSKKCGLYHKALGYLEHFSLDPNDTTRPNIIFNKQLD